MRYFSNPKCYVTITMEGGDFQVDSDIATSVAIIINELLQNSLKYAFQDRSSGEIRIVVEQGSCTPASRSATTEADSMWPTRRATAWGCPSCRRW